MKRRRYPILPALAAQALGLGATVLLAYLFVNYSGFRPPLWALLAVNSMLAVGAARFCGLSRWWILFEAAFVPAVIGLHALALPPFVYLAAFLLVLLVNWNSFRHGIPLYLTSEKANRRLETLLRDRQADFAFIDLGCGVAGTLCHLARAYPRASFTGVETAPLTFVLAWLRALPLRNCRIRYRSLWRVSLTPYDVVYCFLSPLPMAELGRKARAELRAGAILVSNTFGIPGYSPDREVAMDDWRDSRLLVWMPVPAKSSQDAPATVVSRSPEATGDIAPDASNWHRLSPAQPVC